MMALRPILVSKYNPPYSSSSSSSSQTLITSHKKPNREISATKKLVHSNMNRRIGILFIATMASSSSSSLLFTKEENISSAYELDLRMVAPDQTIEEAQNGIQNHAKALLQVKDLIESKSWLEAQKELRKSSSMLKQDIYTIIQEKPGNERPSLRNLYSNLFNIVTKLDYAARDEDESRVLQYYDKIVLALDDILSKL